MSQGDLFDQSPPREAAAVRFISAGAGSGKTYRLTEELERALTRDGIEPGRIIATTFTVKAAAELNDRVRARLIESGRGRLAERMSEGLIGTVHSVCERLLKRFCFELGLSPALNVVSIEDGERFFAQALDRSLDGARVRSMNDVAQKLEIDDWQRDVKAIVDAARSNDVSPDALADMGRRNAGDLLAYFPKAAEGNLDRGLFSAVKAAADGIEVGARTTAKTRNYLALMERSMYQLRRSELPWPRWIALANESAGKRDGGETFAAAVRDAAAHYDRHPRMHRDIEAFIKGVFDIAGKTLEAFQSIKVERGLIDFTDMEQLVLHALDDAAIRTRLRDELDLLLVDEFQDTNPMQLALFMKLLPLARRAIFVGDVKQAIYAFRGADPDLVFATLAGLAGRGGETDVLPFSWRSRPPLVRFCNQLFSNAFARDGIDAHEVVLKARRGDDVDTPPVSTWRIEGPNNTRWTRLARAIGALVRDGIAVVDPDANHSRIVRYGDIAVLAATNDHVEAIARALRQLGVPIKMSLDGLQAVPEIVLAKACLRRLDDATDTLASAEIVALTATEAPEAWLASRLRDRSIAWGEAEHPMLNAIARLRDDLGTRSPVEIVARVLNYVGIRAVVTAWGPDAVTANQRQRNLDAFLDLAVQYEQHCAAQHEPASLTGFLFWAAHPTSPELDLQPVVTGGDAVHVLTYHKAKGLEWPVVVASDLDYAWRSRLFDVRVMAPRETFDIERPLAGRHIRFWPNPFGARKKGVAVLAAVEASPEGVRCEAGKRGEERRLAYVGLTRARDVLVLVESGDVSQDSWRAAFDDESSIPPAVAISTTDVGAPQAFAPSWFESRFPAHDLPIASVNASAMGAVAGARVGRIVELGARLVVRTEAMDALGNALHRIIAARCLDQRAEVAAEDVLAGFGVRDAIDADDALEAARRLCVAIDAWRPLRVRVEHPVSELLENGQTVRGYADLLVDTADGVHIIDHKSSPRPRSEWVAEALAYSGQLRAYRNALSAAGERVAGTWIHFVVTGALVEVMLD